MGLFMGRLTPGALSQAQGGKESLIRIMQGPAAHLLAYRAVGFSLQMWDGAEPDDLIYFLSYPGSPEVIPLSCPNRCSLLLGAR